MSEAALHARLSPSGATRWMACPGSPVLEATQPDKSSTFADEGTAAHTLAAWCLTGKTPASIYKGEKIIVGSNSFTVDDAMIGYVQDYVNFVLDEAKGGHLMVEVSVPIGHLTGEEGATGTSDAIIVFAAEKRIKVIDLKYGMGVKVNALRNKQAMIYGLGAVEECSLLADIDEVSLYIHQPRLNHVSEYHVAAEELALFANEVAAAADTCTVAAKHHATAGVDEADWIETYLSPGEEQCRFCRAKGPTCPAMTAQVTEMLTGSVATAEDFANMAEPDPVNAETGDNWLSVAMSKVGLIEDWCKATRAEVERRLFTGSKVDGFKLVEGKRGNRAWRDEAEVEAAFKSMRLKQDEMYARKLISPAAAEKLLKKASPRQWAKAEQLMTRSEGKPSVAPASDPRPEMAITATADDFAALAQVEGE